MADLSGTGIIETFGGEFIKWSGGKLASAGTYSYKVTAGTSKTAINGRVYYADNLLEYSDTTIGLNIRRLANTPSSQFSSFYQLLANSTIYNSSTGDIKAVLLGNNYTVFVPNNDAIQAATDSLLLPADPNDGSPFFTTTDPLQQKKISDFILYHIVDQTTIVPNGAAPYGKTSAGQYATLYRDASGVAGQINVIQNAPNVMKLQDAATLSQEVGHTANVVIAKSNNLANRCVIHLIDTYLQY